MRGLAEIQHRGFDLDEATFGQVEGGLRALAEVFRRSDDEIEDQSEVAADTCCAQNFKGHARPASPRSCPGSAFGPLRPKENRPPDAAQEVRAGRRLPALVRAGVPTPTGGPRRGQAPFRQTVGDGGAGGNLREALRWRNCQPTGYPRGDVDNAGEGGLYLERSVHGRLGGQTA